MNPVTGQGTPVGLAGDGTSYAAPYVTAAAALIKQVNPDFTSAQIMAILQQSGQAVYDPASGLTFERLNIGAAIALAYKDTGPGSPPISTPFSGTPISIPGIIQAENFDNGGQGVAFNDTVIPGHSTGLYRTTPLAIEKIARKAIRHWLHQSRRMAAIHGQHRHRTHRYNLSDQLANVESVSNFHIEVDGVDVTGELSVPGHRQLLDI